MLIPVSLARSEWEYFFTPLDGMVVHRGDAPALGLPVPIYTWVKRGATVTIKVSCSRRWTKGYSFSVLFWLKQKSGESKRRPSFSNQDQGGSSLIHDKLFQYRERLPAVRAGQRFQDCVQKEDLMATVRHTLYTVEWSLDVTLKRWEDVLCILEWNLGMTWKWLDRLSRVESGH